MVLLSKKVHDKCRNQAHKLHQRPRELNQGCPAVLVVLEAVPPVRVRPGTVRVTLSSLLASA